MSKSTIIAETVEGDLHLRAACALYGGDDWRDSRGTGAESVGYIGGTTGGTLIDTGAESVGYIGERRSWRRRRRRKRMSLKF